MLIMTLEHKPYRSRRIVDYSQFIGGDSDSDDFALPSTKKTKTSKSSLSNESRGKLSSSDIKPAINENKCSKEEKRKEVKKNEKKVLLVTDNCATLPSCEIENDSKKSFYINESPLIDSVQPLPDTENEKNTSEISNLSNSCSTNKIQNKSNEDNIGPNDSLIKLSKPKKAHQDSERTKQNSKNSDDKTTLTDTKATQQINGRKWKPPSLAVKEATTKVSHSLVNSGLRLGLSRNARTKSLHSNVKIKQ